MRRELIPINRCVLMVERMGVHKCEKSGEEDDVYTARKREE